MTKRNDCPSAAIEFAEVPCSRIQKIGMAFDKLIENKIREAMDKGEFDNLPGKGQPLDLDAYFSTPEELRLQYSILKNANVLPPEVELLGEIESLRQQLESCHDDPVKQRLRQRRDEAQIKLCLLLERYRKKS